VPALRKGGGVREVCGTDDVSPQRGENEVPFLRCGETGARGLSGVPVAPIKVHRGRDRATGGGGGGSIAGGAMDPDGFRQHEGQGGTREGVGGFSRGANRYPSRHPDDRQGAAFSQGDVCGSGGGGFGAQFARLPRFRAGFSTFGAGGRSGGSRGDSRRGFRADLHPVSPGDPICPAP